MKKAFICSLMVIILIFTMAFAAEFETEIIDGICFYNIDGAHFFYAEDEQTLDYYEDSTDGKELTIPSNVNGKTVKMVSNYLNSAKKYKKVVLVEGIEKVIGLPLADEYVFPKSLTRVSHSYKQLKNNLPNTVFYDSATEDGKLYIEPDIRIVAELDELMDMNPYAGDYEDACYVTEFVTHKDNKYFKSVDGVLYSKDMKTLVRYPFANPRETFKIPEGVEKIAPYAFSNCSFLKYLYLSDTVNEIGEGAFQFFKRPTMIYPDERFFSRDFTITLNGKTLDVNAYMRDGVYTEVVMIEEEDFNKQHFQKYEQYFAYEEIVDGKTYVPLDENLTYVMFAGSGEHLDEEWEKRKRYSVVWKEETRTVVIKEVVDRRNKQGN